MVHENKKVVFWDGENFCNVFAYVKWFIKALKKTSLSWKSPLFLLNQKVHKGAFNDYVDQILPFFDHHLPIVDKRGHLRYHLPLVHVDNSKIQNWCWQWLWKIFQNHVKGVTKVLMASLQTLSKVFLQQSCKEFTTWCSFLPAFHKFEPPATSLRDLP